MYEEVRWWKQPRFAWWAGIALPVAMVLLDPMIFKVHSRGTPMMGEITVVSYAAMTFAILALAYHLMVGRQPAFVAGLLAASVLFAAFLALLLVPLGMIGFFAANQPIGIFGISPVVTGLAFAGQVRVAMSAAPRGDERWPSFFSGVVVFAAGCILAEVAHLWLGSRA